MLRAKHGFTLMEILIAMSVLIVGLVGILALFPAGLNATRKSIEDTTAAMIAESVYASLRAAAQKTVPGGKLEFFHDGVDTTKNKFPLPSTINFTQDSSNFPTDTSIGIPNHYKWTTTDGAVPVKPATEGTPVTTSEYRVLKYTDAASIINSTMEPLTGAFCTLGQGTVTPASPRQFDVRVSDQDEAGHLKQYSFNIQIASSSSAPKGLYDVTIRICRNTRLVRTFYSKIYIPTN